MPCFLNTVFSKMSDPQFECCFDVFCRYIFSNGNQNYPCRISASPFASPGNPQPYFLEIGFYLQSCQSYLTTRLINFPGT